MVSHRTPSQHGQLIYFAVDSDPIWQRELAEEYANSTNFSDGEIYRKIYQYILEQDKLAEKKWWARLTKKKSEFLNRFFKHKRFPAAFNALTDIPGIWDGLNIGVLDKMMALKCDEVSNQGVYGRHRSDFP
ncbi:MAG: hypothetical protein CL912_19335 [Deltaproteobacteria bacterium]|jgi:hypothetical protein|nr:hypothetical protein [Deltaproteobacteria bacterium]|tara:strand:- start:138 stop:530 length:393 start_codon:yes stop_codon:yes gene_type:complete